MVLAHIRHEDGIIGRLFCHSIDHLTHQQRPLLGMDGGLDDLRSFHLIKRLERIAPRLMVILIQQSRDGRQRLLTISHHRHIGLHILINLTAVNVKMDNLRLLGIGLQITRHPVTETHTDGNEHVALLFLQIHGIVTVHSQHTHIERMIRRQGGKPQHRAPGRDIGLFKEGPQFALGITQFHALSYKCQRLLGTVDQFGSLTYSLLFEFGIRHVRTDEIHFLRIIIYLLNLGILSKVEHHWAWTPCPCDIEGTAHGPRHILSMANLVTPFGYWLRYAHKVYFLKGIRTQGRDRHLACYDNYRRRIQHGISNTRQGVCHTRATGDQGHSHLARHSGIAFSGMGGTLFVTHQNMVETFLLASCIVEECIVDGHNRAAGIAKNGGYPLCLQGTHQCLRACNLIFHFLYL